MASGLSVRAGARWGRVGSQAPRVTVHRPGVPEGECVMWGMGRGRREILEPLGFPSCDVVDGTGWLLPERLVSVSHPPASALPTPRRRHGVASRRPLGGWGRRPAPEKPQGFPSSASVGRLAGPGPGGLRGWPVQLPLLRPPGWARRGSAPGGGGASSRSEAGQRFPDQLAPVCRLPPPCLLSWCGDRCGVWVPGWGPSGRSGLGGPAGQRLTGARPAPPVTQPRP